MIGMGMAIDDLSQSQSVLIDEPQVLSDVLQYWINQGRLSTAVVAQQVRSARCRIELLKDHTLLLWE